MISRLSAAAAVFAVLATATLAYAAGAPPRADDARSKVQAMPVVQLGMVTVIGRRADLGKP